MKTIFLTGATGYIGSRLSAKLLKNGHRVIALVRKGSEHKVCTGAEIVVADPMNPVTFQEFIPPGVTYIQLLGVPHPSPKKAKEFEMVDGRSVCASVDAAAFAGVDHFIYVSVAMSPSKLMHTYQQVRKRGEEYCIEKIKHYTIIRPWYVLGPGHWWPLLILPFYGLAELIPSWRIKARAKALVSIGQMLDTLMNVATSDRKVPAILEIDDIRRRAGKI